MLESPVYEKCILGGRCGTVGIDNDFHGKVHCLPRHHDSEKRRLAIEIRLIQPEMLVSVQVEDGQSILQLPLDESTKGLEKRSVMRTRIGLTKDHNSSDSWGRTIPVLANQIHCPIRFIGKARMLF
jgi:hypothetical protein